MEKKCHDLILTILLIHWHFYYDNTMQTPKQFMKCINYNQNVFAFVGVLSIG